MGRLGNPQNRLKVIHVVGTSGKGSTAYLLSILLRSHRLTVGLNVKPHVTDIRERFQINNSFISEQEFVRRVNSLLPIYEEMDGSKNGPPSYYEMTVALAFLTFLDHNVDYSIIETGMGGQYDATNIISNPNKLVLYTKIGFDHVKFLGNTLSKIAFEKARVIKKNNHTIAIWQGPRVRKVVEDIAKEESATLNFIQPKIHIKNIHVTPVSTFFDFSYNGYDLKNVELGLHGKHQAENATLALAGLVYLSKRDGFILHEEKIRDALKRAHFAARCEKIVIGNKTVVVDGAHNPQKMRALVDDIQKMFPGKKFTFLIGFKEGKDSRNMLKILLPFAKHIVVTDFFTDEQDWRIRSDTPQKLGKILVSLNFKNFTAVPDPQKALKYLFVHTQSPYVITGSLYLIGKIYKDLQAMKK